MRAGRSGGFTLLELMVVVTIIAVLASIAYPAFNRQAARARRTDAKDALMGIASAEERYFTNFNTYVTSLTTLGLNTSSPSGYYTLTVVPGSLSPTTCAVNAGAITTTYILQAAIVNATAQKGDVCGTLMLDSSGVRCPNPSNVAANANGSCW